MNVRKTVLWTVVLLPLVLLAVVAVVHFREHPPNLFVLQASVQFLTVLESAYLLTIVSIVVLGPIAIRMVVRRRGPSRSRPARFLLLAGSLAITFVVAEVAVAMLRPNGPSTAAAVDRDAEADSATEPPTPLDPLPTTFAEASSREIRLTVVGESSAEGVPYNAYISPVGLVAWQLGRIFPDRAFRVETLAVSGSTLAQQYDRLRHLTHRPDILVVYCGHNEFSARFAWSRDLPYYVDDGQPSGWLACLAIAERYSAVCRWIGSTTERLRVSIPPPPEGNRGLVDSPAFRPREARQVRDSFAQRLTAIATWAESLGIVTVLVSPPSNDSGFEPNRSCLEPSAVRSVREAFAHDFRRARSTEADNPTEAERLYRDLLKRGPGFAETYYRLGRLLEQRGEYAAAAGHDRLARDLDVLPMRCPSPLLVAYAQAGRASGAAVIDGPELFRQVSPHGILDDHLFHDGMHPSMAGQIVLAEAILAALKARRALDWPADLALTTINPTEVAHQFGIDNVAWYRLCKWGAMFYDKTAPARYDPSTRRQRLVEFDEAAARLQRNEPVSDLDLPNIGVPDPLPLPTADPSWLRIAPGPSSSEDPADVSTASFGRSATGRDN